MNFRKIIRFFQDKRILCHICAQKNRWAFNQLIYKIRGEHICQKCGLKFTVKFTPANK